MAPKKRDAPGSSPTPKLKGKPKTKPQPKRPASPRKRAKNCDTRLCDMTAPFPCRDLRTFVVPRNATGLEGLNLDS